MTYNIDTAQGSLVLTMEPPVFVSHTQPHGALSRDPRAQACWHFYTLAEKQREMVGNSVEDQFGLFDTELWMDRHYIQTARSVAMIHGLESPDEFAKAWPEVREEALACRLPVPHPSYTKLTPRFVIQ
jgi:hypothetical protein